MTCMFSVSSSAPGFSGELVLTEWMADLKHEGIVHESKQPVWSWGRKS